MPQFSLFFLLGILILQFFSYLPSKNWLVLTLGTSFFLLALKPLPSYYQKSLIAALLGFSWCLYYATAIASFSLPPEAETTPRIVQGSIISLPQVSIHQSSFLFQVHSIQYSQQKPQPCSTRIRLNWRHPPTRLRAGDHWRFVVRLKRIHGTMNPGGFDYEAWAFQKGIRASGYVLDKEKAILVSPSSFSQTIDRLRQTIQVRAQAILPSTKTSPWLLALMIGERNGIPPSEWEVLRKTGTNHLMAIAGLHIGLMASFTALLVRWIWRRQPGLTFRLPAYEAAAAASLVVALFYSALAGFSIPTQRASIMLSIYLIATLCRRLISPWQVWSLALILVLILNPLSVLSSSFWLSFTTIALIIYGMSGRLSPQGLWWKWGRPQWVIALGLLPLSLWIFTQYSLVSFVANAIAIPWVGFLVLPLCFLSTLLLLICPGLAKFVLILADKNLAIIWSVLSCFSQLSWASWQQTIPHYGYLLAAFAGVLLLLMPQGFPGKYLGFCYLLPILFFKAAVPAWGEARFSLLDVGQGLSAVVQTQHHVLVFDTGARYSAEHDMGESVVLPFLQAQGIKQLDLLIVSHGDNDHSGGAAAILAQMPVLAVQSSVPLLFSSWKADYCLQGMAWNWDGVQFSYLNPSPERLNQGNNSSCVLQVATKSSRLLLPGDIELAAERALVANPDNDLASDILVAPHHGSKTSGLREFIGRVHPQYVLYAIGYRNRYHFPHRPIVQSYQSWAALQYNTVDSGAIQFSLGKNSLGLAESYRLKNKHYWNDA